MTRKRFSACWGKLPNPLRTLPSASSCASVPDALTAVPAKENAGVNHHPGFKKHLLALAASTLFVVLVYTLFPVCAQRGTAPDRANCFADHLIIQRSSFAVTLIVDCTICADSELTCGLYCVNISTKEQKLPTVFCFLSLDHLLHFFAVVPAAGIFHSVRSDYKHGVFRHILRSCVVYHQQISNWVFECSTAFALKRIK